MVLIKLTEIAYLLRYKIKLTRFVLMTTGVIFYTRIFYTYRKARLYQSNRISLRWESWSLRPWKWIYTSKNTEHAMTYACTYICTQLSYDQSRGLKHADTLLETTVQRWEIRIWSWVERIALSVSDARGTIVFFFLMPKSLGGSLIRHRYITHLSSTYA